ncbi:thiamine phosphate synthase [Listeria welshimeri]|uniref:Thiamine-phosphate synthase n=1 Tax=Listeria welshimeri TaxID=1643 RepID=A0A7X0T4E3_LISWE|nr:thiamine phosphate synthase [Listeria welshimeri]MBC1322337.1 thiamine phosphate synthase [Listeria welshimeri]MBC1971493.1 thiamine phosphate synthase [Listeria welshimeri]MBC1991636.1 thiamine phosphate synthase [Listeria welshimeri]MBF2471818.1 thiamine phosphate synthase [Listeria welshimeri]
MKEELAVYFIAGTQDIVRGTLPSVLEEALKGGITCFQYREKGAGSLQTASERKEMALECQKLCAKYQVPFIINDDVVLALEIGADGIHVGQNDEEIHQVITSCAGKMKIGLSVHSVSEAEEAERLGAVDYIGVGPIFPTISKADAEPESGTEILEEIRRAGIKLPIVGIGGINEANTAEVLAAGADGVSVISAITRADDYQLVIQNLKNPGSPS